VSHPFPVVLVAASAGGIPALSSVLRNLPVDFPAALIIVQHRTAGRSALPAILARASAIPIRDAADGGRVDPGVAYIAPPDHQLVISPARTFEWHDGERVHGMLGSANPLFESGARVFGPSAIAVVLSGSGMDGTGGVQAIKAAGGTVIVQDQATSQVFGMPRAAIRSGAVDRVLAIDQIAPALVQLITERAPVITGPATSA